MSIHNSSYFNRHKLALNQTKGKSNKPSGSNSGNGSALSGQGNKSGTIFEESDSKILESVHERNKSSASYLELELNLPKTQEQKVYEEYKEMKAKYEAELAHVNAEILKLKKLTEEESKKVEVAQTALQIKKQELAETKRRYE